MKRVPFIRQHDEKDCGAACLSMILDYWGKKLPMAAVREAVQADQYGTNIRGLLEGAEQYGLQGQALEGSADDVWSAITAEEIPLPAIVRIVNQEQFEHYLVVTGVRRGKLLVCDPAKGRCSISRALFVDCFLGQIITFSVAPNFHLENSRQNRYARFLGLIGRQKALLAGIGLLSLGVTGIGLLGAFLFQFLIDDVLGGLAALSVDDAKLDFFAVLLTAVAILYLFKFLMQMLRGKLLTRMSRQIDLPLMLGFFNHVTGLPMSFFDRQKTGEILSRFSDAGKIRDAISGATLTVMIDVVLVIACGIILYRQSSVLFAIALVIFLAYSGVTVLYARPMERFNHGLMEQSAQCSAYLKETLDGMGTVKAAQAEAGIRERMGALFRRLVHRNTSGSMLALSKDAIIDAITGIGSLALLWVGAVSVISGKLTLGALISFFSLLNYFLTPIQDLVELQSSIQTALVAADRLNDFLELNAEQKDGAEPEINLDCLALEHVCFRYGTRARVLEEVSFRLQRGERIALVGESGCGKSTVAKLMLGFYSPEQGQILLNGAPIGALSFRYLRRQIAYVPQETFLFSDTIRNNLLLGLEGGNLPSDETLEQVLKVCCCEFVQALPFGLDSMLEENGANLSGGQRQRLAIARALLRKPQLLILDEATSALDAATEAQIQQSLAENCPDMAIVFVTHRLDMARQCSKILVLDHGKLTEQGEHTELLARGGCYAALWDRQTRPAA